MEDDSLGAERAVARTLNQIQNLPNLQYVLALGPRIIWGERPGEYRSSTDLLKLTRFQEIVPELDAETVLREIRELRDAALAGEDCWYPWNRVGAETDDPLYYNPISRYIGVSQRLADILGGLLRTPRVFKTVLRETTTAWNNGLRGELNWYDLILLNAIKAACPSVFEWVARDLSTFIGYPGFHRRVDTQDGALLKAEANELKVKTERTVGRADAGLAELVVSALEYLFPTFAARISARADPIEPPAWDQRISAYSLLGPASIERFFAGRVPSDDVPDQFILRFIHKTNREPLDKEAFREQFLLSGEASRKRMNKLVHFAGLLSQAPALGISGGILDWASSLEHPQDQMDNYPQDVLGLVTALLKNCGDPQYEPGGRPVEPNPTEAWLTERIRLCTPETAVLTILLVHQVLRVLIFSAETEPRWRKELAQALYRQFVEDNKPFRGAVHQSRYSLLWLLQGMSAHDQYEGFRGRMTERVLAEATADTTGLLKSRLIHALVYDSHAAVSGEAPLESYTFGVKQDDNARLFDMDAVIATVRTWDPTLFEDEVSCRAFLYFMDSYALSSQ
jgi:hypothetical protein